MPRSNYIYTIEPKGGGQPAAAFTVKLDLMDYWSKNSLAAQPQYRAFRLMDGTVDRTYRVDVTDEMPNMALTK